MIIANNILTIIKAYPLFTGEFLPPLRATRCGIACGECFNAPFYAKPVKCLNMIIIIEIRVDEQSESLKRY